MTVQVSARAPRQIGLPAVSGVRLPGRAALYRWVAAFAAVVLLGVCAGDRADAATTGGSAPGSGIHTSAPLIP